MADEIIDLGHGFHNIRGSFRIAGVINVGTQASLVQLDDQRFVFLDSYSLTGAPRDTVMGLTDGGRKVVAILNLHPFHTVHCAQMAEDFPNARLFGSARHKRKYPKLDWEEPHVESPDVAAMFPELEFSLPRGVQYIPENEKIHAGSLLAYHPASRTLHVDDTFNVLPLPKLVKNVLGMGRLSLHPTLKSALEDRPGAGADFCDWAEEIATRWGETQTLCAAHSALAKFGEGEFSAALRAAVESARPKLVAQSAE